MIFELWETILELRVWILNTKKHQEPKNANSIIVYGLISFFLEQTRHSLAVNIKLCQSNYLLLHHKVRLIVINPYLLLGGIDSYEPAVIVTDYDVSTIIAIESSESVVNNACVSLMLFVLQRHLMLFSEPLRSKSMVELDSSESLVTTCSSNLRRGTISLLRG